MGQLKVNKIRVSSKMSSKEIGQLLRDCRTANGVGTSKVFVGNNSSRTTNIEVATKSRRVFNPTYKTLVNYLKGIGIKEFTIKIEDNGDIREDRNTGSK